VAAARKIKIYQRAVRRGQASHSDRAKRPIAIVFSWLPHLISTGVSRRLRVARMSHSSLQRIRVNRQPFVLKGDPYA